MKHEKILKRDDGSRIKIEVEISSSFRGIEYRTAVFTCGKGKRTWLPTYDGNNYQFRALSMDERREFIAEANLRTASSDEILQAKLELWELMKPAS